MTNKKRWILCVFALACVSGYGMISIFDKNAADTYSYAIISIGLLTIGIPHGAVDHLIQKDRKKQSLFVFIVKYLLIVSLYFFLWQYFPMLSLLFFVFYSSFHFGESELEEIGIQIESRQSIARAFFLGLSILLFIIFSHYIESINVISKINGLQFFANFDHKLVVSRLLITCLAFLFILYQWIVTKKQTFLAILFFLMIGAFVPLTFAFALYFITQHSYNSWLHIQKGLSLNARSLYIQALPYTLGAIGVFALILAAITFQLFSFQSLLAYFYVFLACISLPHTLLMHLFYKK